jgi:protein SCO1/2
MKRTLSILIPLLAALLFGIYYFSNKEKTRFYKRLPILGNHSIDSTRIGSTVKYDTLWHRIPNFSFTNQDGQPVTQADVQNKVYVADYFFTTCQSICPIMSKQLDRVAAAYKNEADFRILSHTVDPETDTPTQLKGYAQSYKANTKQWIFLTGEKPALYELARKGYLLNLEEGDGGPDDFIHTQNFALIDRHQRIRGFYDGTDSAQVNNLIQDIGFVLQEK